MSISSDNFTPVDGIRTQKVLDAREAIQRGRYDSPAILDTALDNLVDAAEHALTMEDAEGELRELAYQQEADRVASGEGSHKTGINFYDDFED